MLVMLLIREQIIVINAQPVLGPLRDLQVVLHVLVELIPLLDQQAQAIVQV